MAEGISLPPAPRETLLGIAEREMRIELARPQILSVTEGETDAVALEATLACLLFETVVQTNFCGFYRRVAKEELAVGPYQGSMGCLRIAFSRGVCGACARTKETQIVSDIHARADHISCDARSRSEIVIPVLDAKGDLRAVLDLDSPHVDGFSAGEARALEHLVGAIFGSPDIVW